MARLFGLAALLLSFVCGSVAAWAQAPQASPIPNLSGPIQMKIVGAAQVSPIAVSALKNLGGDDQHELSGVFVGVLRRDLKLSGFFQVINPHAYIENAQTSGYDLGQFNFADWSSINAEFLVKGAVKRQGNNVQLEALLFDVANQRRMMGKQFTGDPHDVGEMARRFADAIMKAITGKRGPFDTKIAFVSAGGGRFKEIYTSWLDGGGLFRVTDNPTINLFPSFDQSGSRLLYLSYKTMRPELYLVDLRRGVERIINPHLGMAVGGTLTPDGHIVGAFSSQGHTNLYLLSQSGNELRQLTNDRAINVAPSVCANGNMMAFTSDRSGTPQIYVMSVDGGPAQRLTYQGSYNTAPAFSPDCKKIAYEGRVGGHFNIEVIDAQGGQPTQLTDEGSNRMPTWSPDGRYIAFSSDRRGSSRIYLMLASDGKVISALTEGEGDDSDPSWSWWLGS